MHDLGVDMLLSVIVLIASAVFVVMVFKKLRLSPVLGYLVAGAIIGDYGLKIIKYEQTELLAEYGVVFLLFAIGLELSFERLKAMRKYVLGLGSLQVVISAIIIAASVVIFSADSNMAVLIGGGLALSSTAIVMRVVEETGERTSQVGRIALAILLLQDFAVVPLLVIVPLLSGNSDHTTSLPVALSIAFLKAVIALIAIFISGRLFLRPLFKMISSFGPSGANEVFIATTLLIVLSAAWGTQYFGLSLALGAFVSGVLVAETEFRRQAEESIYPFKGLLLGLFFMSVGMTIDVMEIYENVSSIIIISFSIIAIKTLIIAGLCVLFGFDKGVSLHAGLLLSQGGEFAFILFNLGISEGIIEADVGKILLLVVTCTMALTPLLAHIGLMISNLLSNSEEKIQPKDIIATGADDLNNHVIIAGFGRVGKMVARVLEAENIHYIVLDTNDDLVVSEEDNGFPIFKGNVSHADILKAAGADRAQSLILTINNEVTLKKSLKLIAQLYPDLRTIVRSKDLKNSTELYDAGATIIVPEDYETGLQIGGSVMKSLDFSEHEIARIKTQFRAGNYVMAKQDEDLFDVEDTE